MGESLGISDVICKAMSIPSGEYASKAYLKSMTMHDLKSMLEAAELVGLFNVIWHGVEELQAGAETIGPCASGACKFQIGQVTAASIKCCVCGDLKKSGRKMLFCTLCPKVICPMCLDDVEEPVVAKRSQTLPAPATCLRTTTTRTARATRFSPRDTADG